METVVQTSESKEKNSGVIRLTSRRDRFAEDAGCCRKVREKEKFQFPEKCLYDGLAVGNL